MKRTTSPIDNYLFESIYSNPFIDVVKNLKNDFHFNIIIRKITPPIDNYSFK